MCELPCSVLAAANETGVATTVSRKGLDVFDGFLVFLWSDGLMFFSGGVDGLWEVADGLVRLLWV
jgi:hypothetical protein